jgi:drug/metabolite transporter (DMT)-like permease
MNIILYILTILIWGSTWFAITFQIGTVSPDVSIFYRFVLASALLFAWCFYKGVNLKYSLKNHAYFIGLGFFIFSMNYLCAYEATKFISSGLNSIGFSMVLVFNIINSAIFFRIPLTLPLIVGTLFGMFGITTVFWPSISSLDLGSQDVIGIGFSLLAGLFASFGNTLSVQTQKEKLPVTESNAFGMAYGSLWVLLFILMNGSPFTFEMSVSYVTSLLYLSLFGTVLAFGCYLTLLGRIGSSRASYALVINPVVALILSTFFEDFEWNSYSFVGICLILFGNMIISMGKSLPKPFMFKAKPI